MVLRVKYSIVSSITILGINVETVKYSIESSIVLKVGISIVLKVV